MVKAPAANDEIMLDYVADDGFVVYVNGEEAGRYNMPESNITYNTFANHYAHSNPDTGTLQLSASLFKQGKNVIAVEVHNEATRSSDILWEADLRMVTSATGQNIYSTDEEIDMPQGDVALTATYRSMTPAERNAQKLNPVCINEVSGSNSIFVNEYGKKNDWVELYNTTDTEIDVEGMYLTDNIDKPTKYQITRGNTLASTKIPAHGYLLVWCDKLETTDQALHASFKIAGEGGYLMLTAADRSWTDMFTYSAHEGNSTVGRYPDGAATVYSMDVPTIECSNMLTSYMVEEPQQKIVSGIRRPDMTASSGDFRIRYGSEMLFVKSEQQRIVTIDIYTTDGCQVEKIPATVVGGTARVSVAHLPAGFYVARATDADGNRVGCKFMR